MAEFMKNAIMLYKPRKGAPEIDGQPVDCKMFDKNSPTFEEDSKGWYTHEEVWSSKPSDEDAKAELIAKANALGIKADNRWGEESLLKAIAKAEAKAGGA